MLRYSVYVCVLTGIEVNAARTVRGTKHQQPNDLGLHIRNWTRCFKRHALSLHVQQEHRSADLGAGKRPHDPLSHLAFDISTTTKRLKSHAWNQHAEYNLRSAELLDRREKHDQVKHLGLCISAWTRRLKSDELNQSEQ